MKTILVLHGGQASGKSTFAKDLISKESGRWKRVNRDSIRLMLDNGEWSPDNEKFVIKTRDFLIREGIKKGYNIIIDDMNFNKNFSDICSIAEGLGEDIQVIEKHFWVSLEEAIERDKKRENSVGEKVIRETWLKNKLKCAKNYNERTAYYKTNDEAENVKKHKHNPNLPKAILVDLDGTLALVGDRNVYDASDCDKTDFINEPVAETVKLYYNAGYKIIFCSGRIDKYKEPTVRFIEKHLPNIEYELFMRHSSDKRTDFLIKDDIFQREINKKYSILLALDDRNQVVDFYRKKLGLTVFQVNYGNF